MEFRIGINLGDVIEEGDTIYGDGVNLAVRLGGLAEGLMQQDGWVKSIKYKIASFSRRMGRQV